jgi:hypothetical protein
VSVNGATGTSTFHFNMHFALPAPKPRKGSNKKKQGMSPDTRAVAETLTKFRQYREACVRRRLPDQAYKAWLHNKTPQCKSTIQITQQEIEENGSNAGNEPETRFDINHTFRGSSNNTVRKQHALLAEAHRLLTISLLLRLNVLCSAPRCCSRKIFRSSFIMCSRDRRTSTRLSLPRRCPKLVRTSEASSETACASNLRAWAKRKMPMPSRRREIARKMQGIKEKR